MPLEPATLPMFPEALVTTPWPVMSRRPCPASPTRSTSVMSQREPAPSTMAVPTLPALVPIKPSRLLTVPPLLMFKTPVPSAPTRSSSPVASNFAPFRTLSVPWPVATRPRVFMPFVVTTALSSTVKSPVPLPPIVRKPDQEEPAPVTSTVPSPVAALPRIPPVAVTDAPPETVRLPVPALPTEMNPLEASHFDPAPLTVTMPFDPAISPMTPEALFTTPWPVISSCPCPAPPITSAVPTFQSEPAPLTTAMPLEPTFRPTLPPSLFTIPGVAPVPICNVPVPKSPTTKVPETFQGEANVPGIVSDPFSMIASA